MREYLVPANVVTRFELFSGFGWHEAGITLVGIAIGGVFFIGLTWVHAPVAARVIVGAMCGAAAYLMTRRVDGVYSLIDYLRLWRRWASRPREYWLW